MNQTVVVMSSADVAAMRKATKEANAAYFEAKVGALRFAVDEMEKTHKEYSLQELSAMTGLSSQEVSAQMTYWRNCRAASEAQVHRKLIRRSTRTIERKFVEVLPNGEINPQAIIVQQREVTTFSIPEGTFNRK